MGQKKLDFNFGYFLKSLGCPPIRRAPSCSAFADRGSTYVRIPGQPYGDNMGKGEVVETTSPYNLEKLDIGRGKNSSGVDSHAKRFQDEKPLFLKTG